MCVNGIELTGRHDLYGQEPGAPEQQLVTIPSWRRDPADGTCVARQLWAVREEPQDDDSSYRMTHLIEVARASAEEQSDQNVQMQDFLERWYGATHCQHSYDCCGGWYRSHPTVAQLSVTRWLVTYTMQRNI